MNLESALNTLTMNRSLTEQFVRDVKSTIDPSDPEYAVAMDKYQMARESTGRYLDSLDAEGKTRSRSIRNSSPLAVQNASADFLAEATSILRPTAKTRDIPFQRGVIVPNDLHSTLHKLKKQDREKLLDQFDEQLRWRSWGEL